MTRHRIITLFVLLLSLAACTKEHEGSKNNTDVNASFFASVSNVITKTPIETGENIPTSTTVGIFAVSYSGSDVSSVVWPTSQANFQTFNLAGTVNSGTPQTISASFYYPSFKNIAFYSYYPKTETATFNSGNSPTVNVDIPSNPQDQKDYLWATPATGNSLSPSVNFVYNHALSLLRFKIQRTGSAATIKSMTITTSQKQKAMMNVATGEMSSTNLSGGATSFTILGLNSAIPLQGAGDAPLSLNNAKFLFVPGSTITAIKLVVDFGESHYNVFTITNPALSLTKGSATNVVLSISNKDAVISSWSSINDDDAVGITTYPKSNCYIVNPNSSITIDVGTKGNADASSAAQGGISTTHKAVSVGILWESEDNLINLSDFFPNSQTVTINTSDIKGNAVIAAYDKDECNGEILWSWHIWVTDPPGKELVNGNTWLDRNLGAIEIADGSSIQFEKCGGLIYQWGRKDPFPGNNGSITGSTPGIEIFNFNIPDYNNYGLTVNNTTYDSYIQTADASAAPISYTKQLDYSIRFPLLFLDNWTGSTSTAATGGSGSWGGEYGQTKSIFDPCPYGWRVPSGYLTGTFANPWNTWNAAQSITITTYAAAKWYNGTFLSTYYYPLAGFRNNTGDFDSVGFTGLYWNATEDSPNAYYFEINYNSAPRNLSDTKSRGYSVRCVKDWLQ